MAGPRGHVGSGAAPRGAAPVASVGGAVRFSAAPMEANFRRACDAGGPVDPPVAPLTPTEVS